VRHQGSRAKTDDFGLLGADLRGLLESFPGAVWATDRDLRVTTVWGADLQTLGLRADELVGKTVEEFFGSDDPEIPAVAAFRRALDGEAASYRQEYGGRVRDGRVEPLRDAGGAVIGTVGMSVDVTELGAAEAALRRSDALIRAVVETALDAIIIMDAHGRIVEFNPAAEAIFGRTREDVVGQELVEVVIPPALREAHRHGFKRHLATGEPVVLGKRLELSGLRADGTEFPVELSITRVPAAGQPVFAGYVRDITERKEAERALAQLAAIVEFSEDAIIGVDLEGKILTWNAGAERLYGYTANEAIGRQSIGDFAPPDHADERDWLYQQVRRGATVDQFETVRLRKDGTPVHISVTLSPIRDEAGEVKAVSVIARDIGGRVEAEEALRRSEESYRFLFEQHPSPVWVYDVETRRFLAVNEAATSAYGYSREEFLAMTIDEIRPIQDLPMLREMAVGDRGYVDAGIWRHRKKNGTLIDVHVVSNAIEFEGRAARLVLAQDVTEQRRLEDQLRQAQKMEAIGSLAGGIAHDFNNILMVIRTSAALMLRRVTDDDATRNLARIDGAAERAAGLTHQLLAFSRQQVLRPELTNVNEVVEETLELVHRLIGEDIEVARRLHPALQPILVDRGQLGQVLLNLAVNARDAMSGGGTLTVGTANVLLDAGYSQLHPEVEPGPYVVLQVTDTGTGMDEDTQARVFDPFFTTKEEGTGLGLATVYGIVKQSNGHVWLYSEPGLGTTFKLYFPATVAVAAPAAVQPEVASPDGTETVLLAEDDEKVREVISDALRSFGYTVLEARDGPEALELARRHETVDLLVTDVVMPGMSGRELGERLTAERPGIRILFTSGYPADAVLRRGIAHAEVAYIEKPYVPDDLARKVREVLDA
jgi:two-component system cell cycle sensor histidine kinase/response regulator CckA